MKTTRACVALAMAACICACTGTDRFSSTATVRDSAGIRIVESLAAAWQEGRAWYLRSSPALEIGVTEGEGPYQLHRVRAAIRLSDGNVVIANAGSNELRMFDRSGRFVTSAGGEGGGPGEFGMLYTVLRSRGDTTLAIDFAPFRISVYDSSLALVQTRTPQQSDPSQALMIFGLLDSGTLLGAVGRSLAPPEPGPRHTPMLYVRLAPSGELIDTIVKTAGYDGFLVQVTPMGHPAWTNLSIPFGRMAQFAAHGDWLAVGNGDTYEVQVFGEEGRLRTVIRRPEVSVPSTAEHLERWRAGQLARIRRSTFRPIWERAFAEMPVPSTLPAFDSLLVDASGNLWVRRYDVDHTSAPLWDVFDGTSRWLGTVTTPVGFTVLEIGADYMLGLWKDDLDVEHVQLYELMRP